MLMGLLETDRKLVNAQLIENLAYSSDNKFFKTEEFRKALVEFKRYGLSQKALHEIDIDEEIDEIRLKYNEWLVL